jgi:hypothetical protein
MRKLLYILFIISPVSGYCNVVVDVYCFESSSKFNNFELRILYDTSMKWSSAIVKYQNSKRATSLVIKEILDETLSKEAPDQTTTTWSEINAGKIVGEYEMMSQGANIYSMIYRNYKTGKKESFFFNPNVESSPETGCVW